MFPTSSLRRKTLYGVGLLVASWVVAGCETTVDIPAPNDTPRLALVYTLSNQPAPTGLGQPKVSETRWPYVSASRRISEQGPSGRSDATIEVLDARGQVVESFTSTSTIFGVPIENTPGYYTPTRSFVGEPGQTYTLRASVPGLDAVESALTLPAAARIDTASFVRLLPPSRPLAVVEGRLSIVVPDNPATTDYYIAYARLLDQQGRLWGYLRQDKANDDGDLGLNFTDRFQLSESVRTGSKDETYVYADTNRNGQTLTLSSNVFGYLGASVPAGSLPPEPAYVEVIVSSVTRDTYLFYQALGRYYSAKDNPFAEPAPLVSNIRNGYGLFSGATDVTYRFPLP